MMQTFIHMLQVITIAKSYKVTLIIIQVVCYISVSMPASVKFLFTISRSTFIYNYMLDGIERVREYVDFGVIVI